MSQFIDIPGLFAAVHSKIQLGFPVYFDYGHYDEVNKNLINKDGSISMKDAKYPLLWMITPFQQKPAKGNQDFYCELSGLDFLILTGTSADESIAERTQKYFIPVLRPILQEFFQQIEASGFFQVLSADAIPYEYIKEWHYQGSIEGKVNLFNDYIDAIQIKGLRLRVNESISEFEKIN